MLMLDLLDGGIQVTPNISLSEHSDGGSPEVGGFGVLMAHYGASGRAKAT